MRKPSLWWLCCSLALGPVACRDDQGDTDEHVVSTSSLPAGGSAKPVGISQVLPPLDLKTLPRDATKTESGIVYKKLVSNSSGRSANLGDTALIQYTGWRQSTGATFFTSGGRGQPIGIDLKHAAPGFAEALQLLHTGEKMMLWIPPSQSVHETLVYEVEMVDVLPLTVAKRTPRSAPASVEGHRQ